MSGRADCTDRTAVLYRLPGPEVGMKMKYDREQGTYWGDKYVAKLDHVQ